METIKRELKEMFAGKEDQVFIVGGAVRDLLQNKKPNDVDLVTTLTREEIESMGGKFIDPKTAFPVWVLHHETLGKIEIAHPRKETKTGTKHQDFEVDAGTHISLVEDLRRRDFTVNSMAMDLNGNVIDPHGGMKHLDANVLKHTSEAFGEDALRVFRALRFASKGFDLDNDTKDVMKSMDVSHVPVERIFSEMMKAMSEKHPEKFFATLVELGIGKDVFAEIHAMKDIPAGPIQFHPEGDVLTHSLIVLTKVSSLTKDPVTRLAGFLHDIGKVKTPVDQLPSHHGHDKSGVDLVIAFLKRFRAPSKVIAVVAGVVKQHMRATKMDAMKVGKLVRFGQDVVGFADALADVVLADADVDFRKNVQSLVSVAKMSSQQLGLTADDFVGKVGTAISDFVFQKRVTFFMQVRSTL